jgi:hypothetical protein
MQELFMRIEDEGLTVRETEAAVSETPEPPPEEPEDVEERERTPQPADPHIEEVTQRLRMNLGTKVTVIPKSSGGGSIHITYHDAEDLERLLSQIAPQSHRSYGSPLTGEH